MYWYFDFWYFFFEVKYLISFYCIYFQLQTRYLKDTTYAFHFLLFMTLKILSLFSFSRFLSDLSQSHHQSLWFRVLTNIQSLLRSPHLSYRIFAETILWNMLRQYFIHVKIKDTFKESSLLNWKWDDIFSSSQKKVIPASRCSKSICRSKWALDRHRNYVISVIFCARSHVHSSQAVFPTLWLRIYFPLEKKKRT